MTVSIDEKTREGGAVLVESFSFPGTYYEVHPESGYCACPAYEHRGVCHKHVITGKAILEARELPVGSELAEQVILDLAYRIFAPYRKQTPEDSYDLFLEVSACRYSTEEMVNAARNRHRKVLFLDDQRAA